VARPTPRTSNPVAIGSSVPACPTFRVPSDRRTTSTTSWEVIPDGLSTSTSPSGAGVIDGYTVRGSAAMASFSDSTVATSPWLEV
jgi:hypothetical protein